MSWAASRSPRSFSPTPKRLVQQVKQEEHACRVCGAPDEGAHEVDHMDRTGPHRRENLQLLCPRCHSLKTQGESTQARMENRARPRPKKKSALERWREEQGPHG